MSEELQVLVQIIELYGRGLGGLGKAIRFSAKAATKGVEIAKVKSMQHRMKLHYASTGTHKTMKLSALEKLTGNQYNILNIPLENEKELTAFYDRLKKMHVSFAELPDLQMGDGYTQIAYNPMDAEKVKIVVKYYKKRLSESPEDITLEEYMNLAGKDGRELLGELAEKGYTEEAHIEQLTEIQEKVKNEEYIPLSLNIESLLLREEKDAYVMRVPRSLTQSTSEHAIVIKKCDVLLVDQGQTIITCIAKKDNITQYQVDRHGNIMENQATDMNAMDFAKAYQPVGKDRLREIGRLKPFQIEIFPSFNQGQETEKSSLAPDALSEHLTEEEKKIGKILSMENLKTRQSNPEYVPLIFDVETQLVAENQNVYSAILPNNMNEETDRIRCIVIGKEDAILSEDGKKLNVYLKESDESQILEFDSKGEKIREYPLKNEYVAVNCLRENRTGDRILQNHMYDRLMTDNIAHKKTNVGKKVK